MTSALDLRDDGDAALELHRVRAALLHEPHRRRQRLLGRGLVGAERQVGDDQRVLRAAAHGAHQRQQLVDGHRQRRLVAEDVVGGRVADEQHRDAGLVEDLRGVLVVGGQHREALAALLHRAQVVDADPLDGVRRRAPSPNRRGEPSRSWRTSGRVPRGSLGGVPGHGPSCHGRRSAARSVLLPAVGDRQPAVAAERLERDLRARRVLPALVLRAVDQPQHLLDQLAGRSRPRAARRTRGRARRSRRGCRRARRTAAASRCRAGRAAARPTAAC